ncbi:MAG: acetyl-CoA carboxylase biotin carboxylase subunit [Ignavibacteriae bacterium]|nr:acetyl-CoA carboxylase biotin carboxylase subunit [Ignavibacteriota bacterium]NOH00322.1 acetyl-CoA carboxylase biotin carboxylase subunit [Ignavibacteriota bacterium]
MFKKILIANRGEIAVRIVKACREMNIISAAIYSDADKNALHVRTADEAYHVGNSPASESYLDVNKVLTIAKKISADAVHPGYGFLSENAEFINSVGEAGITFIGPSAESVKLMGEKTAARRLMEKSKVPIVPGTVNPIQSIEEGKEIAEKIGYPVMLKAAAGGGGKGMRKVFSSDEFSNAFERAKNESKKAFSDDNIYIEKFIENPKHIEVQILGDQFGNYIHLYERDCSVQRRHQKVIEEAPSAFVDEETRKHLTTAAINAAKACNYFNAGTIEFLMDENKDFYFLEMNTRLQVEHPVTEMITGIDLVKEQIKIAAGEKLKIKQNEFTNKGFAIECRVYAEDVDNNFAPSIGTIIHHRLPSGPGIRVDRGIDLQTEVSVYYDPLLSKLIAWGKTRDEAIARMKRALGEYQIAGVITNMGACRWVLNHPKFLDSSFTINFIDEEFLSLQPGEWKNNISQEINDVVTVMAALLKAEENKLMPSKYNCSGNNNWDSEEDA